MMIIEFLTEHGYLNEFHGDHVIVPQGAEHRVPAQHFVFVGPRDQQATVIRWDREKDAEVSRERIPIPEAIRRYRETTWLTWAFLETPSSNHGVDAMMAYRHIKIPRIVWLGPGAVSYSKGDVFPVLPPPDLSDLKITAVRPRIEDTGMVTIFASDGALQSHTFHLANWWRPTDELEALVKGKDIPEAERLLVAKAREIDCSTGRPFGWNLG